MKQLPVPISELILTPTDAERLDGIHEALGHAYACRQIGRTETEMRISVLSDVWFPTPAAKYWQCVREECVQAEQLALHSLEARRNQVALLRARRRLEQARDELDVRDAQIDIDQCLWNDAGLRQKAADRVREIILWEQLKAEQVAADPTFDRDDVNTHQLVSYTRQFIIRANHADPSKLNSGELDNLIGQFRTGVRRAIEMGVLNDVVKGLPDEQQLADSLRTQAAQFPALTA